MPKAAESLQRWEPGQVAYLDRHGNIKPRRHFLRQGFLLGLGAYAPGIVLILLHHPLAAFASYGIVFSWLMVKRAQMRPIMKAMELLAADRRDEARTLLEQLDAVPQPRHVKFYIDRGLGGLYWTEGGFDYAIDRLGRAAAFRPRSAGLRGLVANTAAMRVECLAAAGRLDEARAARPMVPTANGQLFEIMLRETDLAIAFHTDDDSGLPDDSTLYDWAKDVLATNRFGASALMLAWAFERRGDAEMARHLIDEAPARMFGWTIERSMPKLHAWAAKRTPPPPPEPLP